MEFGYFSEVQAEQFPFFRMPKVMFGDRLFKGISRDGKVLYGLLLDRVSLSRENGWIDDEGHVYVIFTLESIQMTMDCSDKSATKYLSELEGFGLIERIRRGQGNPDIIYVKNFSDQKNLQVKTRNNFGSGLVKSPVQDSYNLRLIILITIILNLIILILSYQRMRRGWDMRHIWMNSSE